MSEYCKWQLNYVIRAHKSCCKHIGNRGRDLVSLFSNGQIKIFNGWEGNKLEQMLVIKVKELENVAFTRGCEDKLDQSYVTVNGEMVRS